MKLTKKEVTRLIGFGIVIFFMGLGLFYTGLTGKEKDPIIIAITGVVIGGFGLAIVYYAKEKIKNKQIIKEIIDEDAE